MTTPPFRQIRAAFDQSTITVYQAYSPAIADAAVGAGRFVPPFRLERMTWIKPSFCGSPQIVEGFSYAASRSGAAVFS